MKPVTKATASGGGAAALIVGLAALITSVHGSHASTTSLDKTPITVYRPHDASGSPLPVTVTTAPNGVPIVIVGAEHKRHCPRHAHKPKPACKKKK